MPDGTPVEEWEATFQGEWSAYLRNVKEFALVVLRGKSDLLPLEETENLLGKVVDLLGTEEHLDAVASEIASDTETRDLVMQEIHLFNMTTPATQPLSHEFASEKLGQATTIKDSVQDYIRLDRHLILKRVIKILNEVLSLIRG